MASLRDVGCLEFTSIFVWLYPVKTTNAAEVIDKLVKQSAIFGNPKRIISDRGFAFTSHDFEEYYKDERINHIMTVTGVPRGNSQIERVNRTLIPLLTKLTAPQPSEWHKYVNKAQRYLNNVPSRSTGMSPFYLLFGTRMKLKEDPMIREIIEIEDATTYHLERDKIRELAKKSIEKVQEENKREYNKKRKMPTQYRENDLVAIRRTQIGPGLKLATKNLGPYRVKKILRNERYIVEKVGEGEGPRLTSTAAEYMKSWENVFPPSLKKKKT